MTCHYNNIILEGMRVDDDVCFTLTYIMSYRFRGPRKSIRIINTDFCFKEGRRHCCREKFRVVGNIIRPFVSGRCLLGDPFTVRHL